MRLQEVDHVERKAGVIPYVMRDGEPVMLFMISSDARYGGDKPQLGKGGVDDGETLIQAALREGAEELGLKAPNMVPHTLEAVHKGTVKSKWMGRPTQYQLTVFAVQVMDENDFDEPHYETARTVWLTADEFAQQGRHSQNSIVQSAVNVIQSG